MFEKKYINVKTDINDYKFFINKIRDNFGLFLINFYDNRLNPLSFQQINNIDKNELSKEVCKNIRYWTSFSKYLSEVDKYRNGNGNGNK